MALVAQTSDQQFTGEETTRRRSIFYVPLIVEGSPSSEGAVCEKYDRKCNTKLTEYLSDWNTNDSMDSTDAMFSREKSESFNDENNRLKRYGIVLNGSINIDDSDLEFRTNHEQIKPKNLTSTPIKDSKECKTKDSCESLRLSSTKEKSKTLPVRETQLVSALPAKDAFLLKSTSKISSPIKYSLSDSSVSTCQGNKTVATSKKSLSFIRRNNSTKLSRNNSLLKSLTPKCVENCNEILSTNVHDLSSERLAIYLKAENCTDLIKMLFFKEFFDTLPNEVPTKNRTDNYEDDTLSGEH